MGLGVLWAYASFAAVGVLNITDRTIEIVRCFSHIFSLNRIKLNGTKRGEPARKGL